MGVKAKILEIRPMLRQSRFSNKAYSEGREKNRKKSIERYNNGGSLSLRGKPMESRVSD